MSLIDDLVGGVDVDGALEQVRDAYVRSRRRRRTSQVAVVAALVVLVGGATAAVWRTTGGDQSLDVVGGTSGGMTPAFTTVQVGDGMVLTLSVDDDHVAIGDVVQVELTLTNQGAVTISGAFGVPHECGGSIGFAVRDRDSTGGVASIGNLSNGDNAWFSPREGLLDAIARQVDGSTRAGVSAVPSAMESGLRLAPDCAIGPSVEQVAPGQSVSRTASWPVWIGPGGDDSFRIDGIVDAVACSGCSDHSVMPPEPTPDCELCALYTLGEVGLPIWVDPVTRIAPPTAEQLTDAARQDQVQRLLDSYGPRMNGATELGFGGWLLQIGDAWLQRIQGERGAVDIWFDATSSVTAVQAKTGNDPVTPPTTNDTCGLGVLQAPSEPAVPTSDDMAALDDPDALVGLDDGGAIVGYFRQGDLVPTQQEMESGNIDPLVGLVDLCGNHTGWMSRDGAFFFTDAEIEAPGFDVDQAVAEKRSTQGTAPAD